MNGHLNEQLSAYLDGELNELDRARAEAHLAECGECRAELEALRRVVRRAATLDDRPPEHDLWAGIAERIATPDTSDVVPLAPRRRRITFTVPQLAAAAVVLMAISTSAGVMLTRGVSRPVAANSSVTGAGGHILAGNPGDIAVASYDSAITGMQRLLDERRAHLDTATVRIVEQNLKIIDAAIAQARTALSRDPANRYLNGHLQRALDRKLDMLRQAATLPAAI